MALDPPSPHFPCCCVEGLGREMIFQIPPTTSEFLGGMHSDGELPGTPIGGEFSWGPKTSILPHGVKDPSFLCTPESTSPCQRCEVRGKSVRRQSKFLWETSWRTGERRPDLERKVRALQTLKGGRAFQAAETACAQAQSQNGPDTSKTRRN